MRMKAIIKSLFVVFALSAANAYAGTLFPDYVQSCTDPSCYQNNGCGSHERCCEVFGNMGGYDFSSVSEESAEDYNPADTNYDDFRGTDDEFNQHTYNPDGGHVAYK